MTVNNKNHLVLTSAVFGLPFGEFGSVITQWCMLLACSTDFFLQKSKTSYNDPSEKCY